MAGPNSKLLGAPARPQWGAQNDNAKEGWGAWVPANMSKKSWNCKGQVACSTAFEFQTRFRIACCLGLAAVHAVPHALHATIADLFEQRVLSMRNWG